MHVSSQHRKYKYNNLRSLSTIVTAVSDGVPSCANEADCDGMLSSTSKVSSFSISESGRICTVKLCVWLTENGVNVKIVFGLVKSTLRDAVTAAVLKLEKQNSYNY